jgi:hypothetical protein
MAMNQNITTGGLGVVATYTAGQAGPYRCQVGCFPPYNDVGSTATNPPNTSALVFTIAQNGTTVYTAPAATQDTRSIGFQTDITCAVGDVLTFVCTSSAPADQLRNAIKTNISISTGT